MDSPVRRNGVRTEMMRQTGVVREMMRRTGVRREMMRRTGSRLMVWGQVHGGPLHPVTMADAITAS